MKLFVAEDTFDGLARRGRTVMVVSEGKIVEMGNLEDFDFGGYPNVEREDVPFLMPGLIDCHVHLSSLEQTPTSPQGWVAAGIQALENLRRLLGAGVIACRDLGSNDGLCLGISETMKHGQLAEMPRFVCAGRALVATGGHGYKIGIECDGVDAFIRACRTVIKEGADVVKVMMSGGVNSPGEEPGPPEVGQDEIDAATREAHARGRKVAVHAHGNTAIRRSVLANVDSIEHGVFNSEDVIDLMLEHGTTLVPTLSAPYYAATEGLRCDPDNPDHKKSRLVVEQHNRMTLLAHKKGVPLAMGTDAGCPFNPYDNACYELVLLNNIGISEEDVLKIATYNGAKLLGLNDLGSLEAGKEASFVILQESPFDRMEAVCGPRQVYLKGERRI